jgi:hypothetical protein
MVKVRKTWLLDGKAVSNSFTIKNPTKDLFDNAIQDAHIFAERRNGKVTIIRNKKSLYISFLDVPDTILIDKLYQSID